MGGGGRVEVDEIAPGDGVCWAVLVSPLWQVKGYVAGAELVLVPAAGAPSWCRRRVVGRVSKGLSGEQRERALLELLPVVVRSLPELGG